MRDANGGHSASICKMHPKPIGDPSRAKREPSGIRAITLPPPRHNLAKAFPKISEDMVELKRLRGKKYTVIYFISGEIVTVFKDGVFNYEDAMRSEVFEIGAARIDGEFVEFTKPLPKGAVIQAFKDLGYTVKV